VGDRKIPLRLRFERQKGLVAGVTKKTLPATFQATEEVGGRQEVWVTLEVGGRQSVGDEKRPLRLHFERQRGLGGRQEMWVVVED